MLSERSKHYLLLRAKYSCEYCKGLLYGLPYEIEHIIPKAASGSDEFNNLAISCSRCNRNKSSHTKWYDPYSGSHVSLFNPRKDDWEKHFKEKRSGKGNIFGLTEKGRATASLLFKATSQYIPPDLKWEKLQQVDDKSLYIHLNHLKFYRLQNKFNLLEDLLVNPIIDWDDHYNTQVEYVKENLFLELCFTRATFVDLARGIRYANTLLKKYQSSPYYLKEIKSALSVLYQQRATEKYIKGDIKGALVDQKESFLHQMKEKQKNSLDYTNYSELEKNMRGFSVKNKFYKIDLPDSVLLDLARSCLEKLTYETDTSLSYLIDIIAIQENLPFGLIEEMEEVTNNFIAINGYGTDSDITKPINLRRRWWYLKALKSERIDLDLLRKDIQYWRRNNLHNGIREINSFFRRINHRQLSEIMAIF